MDAFWGWLFNAPVWIQAPLVILFLVILSGAVAAGIIKVMRMIIPPSVAEKEMIDNSGSSQQSDSQ